MKKSDTPFPLFNFLDFSFNIACILGAFCLLVFYDTGTVLDSIKLIRSRDSNLLFLPLIGGVILMARGLRMIITFLFLIILAAISYFKEEK